MRAPQPCAGPRTLPGQGYERPGRASAHAGQGGHGRGRPRRAPRPARARAGVSDRAGRAQSLAKGAAGIALLHIERARAGMAGWDTAHAWLVAATHATISTADDAGLYFGAPAVAFALHTA
jgi:Lanthionine synthetase C-like protein